jgi:hypothetical protein
MAKPVPQPVPQKPVPPATKPPVAPAKTAIGAPQRIVTPDNLLEKIKASVNSMTPEQVKAHFAKIKEAQEKQKERHTEYLKNMTPEQKEKHREAMKLRNQRPEVREKQLEYRNRPEVKDKQKAYRQRPEVKAKMSEKHKQRREEMKAIVARAKEMGLA